MNNSKLSYVTMINANSLNSPTKDEEMLLKKDIRPQSGQR